MRHTSPSADNEQWILGDGCPHAVPDCAQQLYVLLLLLVVATSVHAVWHPWHQQLPHWLLCS